MKNTRKLFVSLFAIVVALSLCCGALAESVYVSISDGEGTLQVAHEAFEIEDFDADGVVSISDALYAAHEAYFEGGASAGYATGDNGYGLSVTKLWGIDNGGSYGYYVNNTAANSLADPVADGDCVRAFCYIDLTAWSDIYSYFAFEETSAKVGEEITLTLTKLLFDESYNAIPTACEGAVLTINGVDSTVSTDADGNATLKFDEAGMYLISARSDTETLVPPVCVVSVSAE